MAARRFIRLVSVAALALGAMFGLATSGLASSREVVEITDDCDPATFNAAVGPGTCVGNGETTFSQFIAELQATQVAEDWAFDPDKLKIEVGTSLTVDNTGGETHTFTKVTSFGGGFVAILNQLSGNTTPAVLAPGVNLGTTFVPAGASVPLSALGESLSPGKNLFQCFIHPWMRTTITVKSDS